MYKPAASDPMNKYKEDLLWYTNFVSDKKGVEYVRRRYNLVDALR